MATSLSNMERFYVSAYDAGCVYIYSFQSTSSADSPYEFVLTWKGGVSARQRTLRIMLVEPELKNLFAKLVQTAAQLSTLSRAVPPPQEIEAWRRRTDELNAQHEKLERELSQRSTMFRATRERAQLTLSQLQATLPTDSVLIDSLEYTRVVRSEKGKLAGARHLAAFIIRREGPVELIDLGPVESIASAVESWRAAIDAILGGPAQSSDDGQEPPQKTLRRLVWEPLEPYLDNARLMLVSPDGALTKAPLAALPGKVPGTYLLEERAIVCLPVPQLLTGLLKEDVKREDDDSSLY